MTLEEKILKINVPSVSELPNVGSLPAGTAATIEDFFETFVRDRLPERDVIKHWHKLLMDYTSDLTKLSCCVRFGNNGTDKASSSGEKGYYKLRRGWLTQNDRDDFEYFFADNFFSSFIYKLALDGVKPSVAEVGSLFRQHKFPYGFGFLIDKKVNEYKGVVVAVAKEPGFLGNYKLSHVFDSGEFFDIGGRMYGDASLTEKHFPIGHSNDFLKNSDRIRRMHISDESKAVIVAKFLRFAHPFNYFLTPAKTRHVCGQPVYKKDIGEDPRMISYVRQYLEKEYPDEHSEFVSKIMWYEDPHAVAATGKERIDITYGMDAAKTSSVTPAPAAKKTVTVAPKTSTTTLSKVPIDLTKLTRAYLETFKVGEIANQVLRAILASGKVPKNTVDAWKTVSGSKATFGLSDPILGYSRKDSKGYNRYYDNTLNLYGEDLYLCSQWKINHKARLITWILNWIAANGGKI